MNEPRTAADIMRDLLAIVEEEAEWVEGEKLTSHGGSEPTLECPECGADGSSAEPAHAENCRRRALILEARGFVLVEDDCA